MDLLDRHAIEGQDVAHDLLVLDAFKSQLRQFYSIGVDCLHVLNRVELELVELLCRQTEHFLAVGVLEVSAFGHDVIDGVQRHFGQISLRQQVIVDHVSHLCFDFLLELLLLVHVLSDFHRGPTVQNSRLRRIVHPLDHQLRQVGQLDLKQIEPLIQSLLQLKLTLAQFFIQRFYPFRLELKLPVELLTNLDLLLFKTVSSF